MSNVNIEADEIVMDLDPLSDRYRVCPNCKIPHMVRNRGRDFCSDRCSDQHYNANRRLMKQAEPKGNSEVVAQTQNEASAPPGSATSLTEDTSSKVVVHQMSAYDRNIWILDAQNIHPQNGTTYSIDDLVKIGFVFEACAGRGILHSIDPKLNCHFLQYGKYRVYRIDFTIVLVAIPTIKTQSK